MKYTWPKCAFVWSENRTRYISIPFTWNLESVRKDLEQDDMFFDETVVGGPAVRLVPNYFAGVDRVRVAFSMDGVLQRINPNATKTTTGCVNRCKFCAVPITEGKLTELDDWPNLPVICDNNLFAASEQHFDRVCDRLEKHSWCDFNQGVDCRLINEHHIERIVSLRGAILRLALDSMQTVYAWCDAAYRLYEAGFPKSRLRSYVLCGYESDPDDAWARCRTVEDFGAMALPMWYHPIDAKEYGAVLKCHKDFGWDKKAKDKIMHYYYQHRIEE